MIHGVALCAGVGGLELGLKLAIGSAYRTVCYVEREAFAAAILAARMADKALDSAPVWDDAATFDGRPWRGRVDIIATGFPCQPASVAGERKGQADERWLWPAIARIIRHVRPSLVFVENVPGLLSVDGGAAMGAVLGTVADLGFAAEWDLFSAAEVGAPHRRERLFLLAVADRQRREIGKKLHRAATFCASRRDSLGFDVDVCGGDVVANANQQSNDDGPCDAGAIRRKLKSPSDVSGSKCEGHSPGRGWWSVEPSIPRVAHGVANRLERLRAIGNGVVPLQAAYAFRLLAARMGLL